MAFTATTVNSAAAWRPDDYSFAPSDVVPEALILQCSTVAGEVEGDAPSMHVGFVTDDEAVFKAEGADLDEADPALSEVLVHTAKLSQLIKLSNEQWNQPSTTDQLAQSVNRAIVRRADIAFLAEPAPVGPAVAPMAGLLNVANIVDGGEVSTNLDVISDLIATLEDNLATPTAIIVDPLGWSEMRKLKIGTGYNSTLLGAGTSDAQQLLYSLPVFVSRGITNYSGLVVDKYAIVSAVGPVRIATSEHRYFDSDGIAIRATWRFGHVVVRPERLGKFTIAEPGS
ncbi:phage major capsid protein [Mycobacterium sp. E3305]|uniref:phage major capsid protein n=1 Tax=Mycobacterium sp. E3305 TaxID=1834145 RepID=UPI0007FEA1CD|nr:phage major capsid protein [Mycobacterium sp. E3305]OBG79098.1 major capsid protein [Mycobacterium sp. E3305]